MKRVFIFVLILLIPVANVKAKCTSKEEYKLNTLATHVEEKYEVSKDQKTFKIIIRNVENGLVIKRNDTPLNTVDKTVTITQVTRSNLGNIGIYGSTDSSCPNTFFRTIYVNLPVYNPYFKEPDCKDYPKFKYCKEIIDKEITEDEFYEAFALYKEEISAKDPYVNKGGAFSNEASPVKESKNEEKEIKKIKEEKAKNFKKWFIIGGSTLFLSLFVIFFVIIKRKKKGTKI